MNLEEAQREILNRRWDWSEMPDDETERIIACLLGTLRPQVPHVSFEGEASWTNAAGSIVVSSHDAPHGFHNDVRYWENFIDEAMYILYGQFSQWSKVYCTFWNVFPRRRLELLTMSPELKARLPNDWPRLYGPYHEVSAPTSTCAAHEAALHSAFRAEGFYFLPNDVLRQPSPIQDWSYSRDGTIGSALFGVC